MLDEHVDGCNTKALQRQPEACRITVDVCSFWLQNKSMELHDLTLGIKAHFIGQKCKEKHQTSNMCMWLRVQQVTLPQPRL